MGDCQFVVCRGALNDDRRGRAGFRLRDLPNQVGFIGRVAVIDLDIIHITGRVGSIIRIEDINAVEGQLYFFAFGRRSEDHLSVKALDHLAVFTAFVEELRLAGDGIGGILSHEIHRLNGHRNRRSRCESGESSRCAETGYIHRCRGIERCRRKDIAADGKEIIAVTKRLIQRGGIDSCVLGDNCFGVRQRTDFRIFAGINSQRRRINHICSCQRERDLS